MKAGVIGVKDFLIALDSPVFLCHPHLNINQGVLLLGVMGDKGGVEGGKPQMLPCEVILSRRKERFTQKPDGMFLSCIIYHVSYLQV